MEWVPGELVGRDGELARLRSVVVDVADGRGGSVWIEGEPGIGKSALLAAGLADAERLGCQRFSATAEQTDAAFPLRTLLSALGVGPGVTEPARAEIAERLWGRDVNGVVTSGDPANAAAELALILIDRLCATRPVVLAVDDLQWADEMSVALWGRLHMATSQLPLLLVGAARPVPQRDDIHRLRRSLTDVDSLVIRLGPLAQPSVTTLVERLVAAPPGPRLQRRVGQAGGNPLYVRELVDALLHEQRIEVRDGVADLIDDDATAPTSLAAAIAARLDFLSEPAARFLRMAALLGMEFQVDDLCLISGSAVTDLVDVFKEALAAGVLAESATSFVFRHGLIHQALYEAASPTTRSELHRQAAQAFAAAGAPVEKVAEQLLAAPQTTDAWAVEWLTDAAPVLIYRAPDLAVGLLDRLRKASDATDGYRLQLDTLLVTALFRLGRYQEVDSLARPLLTTIVDPETVARIAWTLTWALVRQAQYEQGRAVIDQALYERSLPPMWAARLRALRALTLSGDGAYPEAMAAALQAEAGGNEADDRLAVGLALHAQSIVRFRYDRDQEAGLQAVERALAVLGDEPESTELRMMLMADLAAALSNLGRLAGAGRHLGQALAKAERVGSCARQVTIRLHTMERSFYIGLWDDVLAELDAACALPLAGVSQLAMRGFRALIAIHRDDQAAVDESLQETEEVQRTGESKFAAQYLHYARALAAERAGNPAEALARHMDLLDPDSTRTFPELSTAGCLMLPGLTRLALAGGDKACAEAATEACSAEADRQPLPSTLAAQQNCRGLIEADHIQVLSAANAFQQIGYPLWRAQALEDAAVLLASRDDGFAARTAYSDALQIYQHLDAAWDVRRASTRLRPLGIQRVARGPRRAPTGWDALSPTELKIARLVAAGMSNPDIASELFLSRYTVQTHISHILSKLDSRSRIDIARQALIQNADTPPRSS